MEQRGWAQLMRLLRRRAMGLGVLGTPWPRRCVPGAHLRPPPSPLDRCGASLPERQRSARQLPVRRRCAARRLRKTSPRVGLHYDNHQPRQRLHGRSRRSCTTLLLPRPPLLGGHHRWPCHLAAGPRFSLGAPAGACRSGGPRLGPWPGWAAGRASCHNGASQHAEAAGDWAPCVSLCLPRLRPPPGRWSWKTHRHPNPAPRPPPPTPSCPRQGYLSTIPGQSSSRRRCHTPGHGRQAPLLHRAPPPLPLPKHARGEYGSGPLLGQWPHRLSGRLPGSLGRRPPRSSARCLQA